jgi:putative phosphoesterase
MRVALISDLHANLIALDAVLADAARLGVDRTICLGDVATLGPRPSEVLERLHGLDCIMGNHDEFLLDAELIKKYSEAPIIRDSVEWCRAHMSSAELDFIRTFKRSLEIPMERGTLFLFHGTPRSHMEDLLAETPADRVDEFLDGHRASVMAGGHTHIQMMRQHRGILIVNPGSVGMPFKEYVAGQRPVILPHAEYAIIDDADGVILRRVALDKHALYHQLDGTTLPLAVNLRPNYA